MLTKLTPIVDFAPADAGLIHSTLKAHEVSIGSMDATLNADGSIGIDYNVEDVTEVAEAIAEALDNV